MKVIKRDGTEQALDLKKILQRISKLADLQDAQLGLKQLKGVNCDALCIEIISNLYDGISSIEIDEISARIAAAKIEHPDYNSLASRIALSNIQKNAPISFSKAMEILYDDADSMSLIDDKVMRAVRKNKQKLNRAISHINDYLFDFFGVKTLEKSYLLKKINVATKKSNIIETPQFMLMRVALGLHNSGGSTNVDDAIESYNVFKDLLMTHASPTLFNSGTKRQQNSSCFLMTMEDDLTSIMKTISDCAHISKYAGGIGINVGDIRAKGSIIKSTNGVTDGIVPLLQTINSITRYINQCFTPDTWVYSKEGPKQMGNITTDDYLVTIDGSFKKVNEVIESQVSKEILEITTNNTMYPVKVTKEHEIYLIKGQKETKNHSKILQDLKAGVIRPDFYSAGQLTTSDFVGYPVSYCEMKTDDYFEWNGLRWTKVKSINKIEYSGPVLDFNMIDNHNYLTDMGLVHNSGKRKGSAAVYLPAFHADILEFLDLRKNTGDENMRARDLFFALWVSDYFMECVENDLDWHLLSPDECPGLTDAYGDAHKELHQSFVAQGKTREILKARDIWSKIIVSQIETGMPYILFGDSVNKKNNQANLGTIKNSNLCSEVLLHSSKDEIAVCNIATMSLPKFVDTNIETGEKFFNHTKLGKVVEIAVANLNKVIDVNFYPVKETKKANDSHRPIIVGAQGLQNCFFELNLPFESKEAKELNSKIYETIQYYCLKKSNELAKIHGAYSTFEGSPASKGEFQHNMWGVDNKDLTYDWDSLKEKVMEFGLRNSMLTASPPTASTSQILGNFESFEPITNNFFTRNTLSGDFPIVNKYLVNDLTSLGLWDTKMKDQIIHAQGSIQSIPEIPDNLKKLYKTVWEIPQRALIDMSRDRGIFTDHTQSLNLYVTAPSIAKISSMLFHCWKSGLKTGVYYTRTKSIAQAIQFTVSKENVREVKKITEKDTADLYCSIDNKEACESCSG